MKIVIVLEMPKSGEGTCFVPVVSGERQETLQIDLACADEVSIIEGLREKIGEHPLWGWVNMTYSQDGIHCDAKIRDLGEGVRVLRLIQNVPKWEYFEIRNELSATPNPLDEPEWGHASDFHEKTGDGYSD